MTEIDNTKVIRTSKTSIAPNKLFLSLNWIGVKAKLKIKFKINGKATMKGTSFIATL